MPQFLSAAAALFLASTAFAQWSGPTGVTNLVFYNTGNLYIGNPGFTNAAARADVVDTAQDGRVIAFHAYAGTPVNGVRTTAIWGETNNPNGRALQGFNFASTGFGAGIWAESASNSGYGIRARATHATGPNWGGYIESTSSSGVGLVGDASSSVGTTYGGYFYSRSPNGSALTGYATAESGSPSGIIGITDSPTGFAGTFIGGKNWFEGNVGIGVPASNPIYPLQVGGSNSTAVGYFGNSSSTAGSSSGAAPAGVKGVVTSPGAFAAGVWGISAAFGGNGIGVAGYHAGSGYAIYGRSDSGVAGYFQGAVHVNGTLSKSSGSFKIDHPLDPDNKYLYHSFVESPDMMNIYNGNTTTDESGYATITLPDWFAALNSDFKYQLTVIDETDTDWTFAKVVRRIENNQFTIRTSSPSTVVSWLVTGIRQDKHAQAHRIPTEQDKEPWNKGRYLHPSLYGKSSDFELQQQPDDPATATSNPTPPPSKLPFDPRRKPAPIEPALTPAIHGGR